jgi:transcriptional regulator with XRE-family HTH domain
MAKKTGPPPSVDLHPKRDQIRAALIAGKQSMASVGKRYGLSRSVLSNYLHDKLMPQAAQRIASSELKDGDSILGKLQEVFDTTQRMLDSCDAALRDPANPDRYFMGPRDYELEVVYLEEIGRTADDQPIYRNAKARLDELLQQTGKDAVRVRYHHADPRKLLLDASSVLGEHLERMAKIIGLIKQVQISIINIKEWNDIKAIILDSTKDDPDVRTRINQRFAALIGERLS